MIGVSFFILVTALVASTLEEDLPLSPCPNVFQYEQTGFEAGQWYGVVNLSTDSTLHSLWLNIVLDTKANILGNWIGDVSTTDNIDFKVENTNMKIHPGPAVAVRFFVRYDKLGKTPKLQAIRLNGREICNANNPQPAVDRPDIVVSRPENSRPVDRPVTRPTESRQDTIRVDRPSDRPVTRPDNRQTESSRPRQEDKVITKPVFGRPSGDGPVYVQPQNPSLDGSNANPYSILSGGVPSQTVTRRPTYQLTTSTHRTTTNRDEDDSGSDSDYFSGGRPTVVLQETNNNNNDNNGNRRVTRDQCGTVVRNNPNPLVVNGKPTLEGQWPWQIALYQTQTVDNKYICGGTLVSNLHVITAAHCVTRKGSSRIVNKNTLTVYLGKHNLRTSVEGVQIRLVAEISVYPEYNATSFNKDFSVLKLRESVQFTEFVRPACLWPENQIALSNVIGKKGAVVGWGFDDTGVASEELTLVEMPIVDQETCIRSFSEFFAKFTSDYTYCAGYRDGTSVCNGDSGGGMVFKIQGIWYLRGLVSLSVARHNEYRCDPSHYVIFTDLAKFLPWIKQHTNDD
ncbi:serine protease gd-like isoform X2 [Leptidea sinapis]|uniref:serine protease gd-like isoform X2 n=1 Tax=Leptidea sinapis TaxID=189913 RepID=UPI0021393046|nr:serine protease gd-like isoform X2 [Leptidea sinapis]